MKKLLFLFALLCVYTIPARAQLVITSDPFGNLQAPVDQGGWHDFKATLTRNVTFTFVGVPPPSQSQVTVTFIQDATGARVVTFGGNIVSPSCLINVTPGSTTFCFFHFDATTNLWTWIPTSGSASQLHGNGPPSNPCTNGFIYTDDTTGNTYSCKVSTWVSLSLTSGSGAPTNPCALNSGYTDTTTGNFYSCNAGTWLFVGPVTTTTGPSCSTDTFTSTPTYTFSGADQCHIMTLTGNVTSITIAGSPANHTQLFLKFPQDGIGGHTVTFPGTFVLPTGFTLNSVANNQNNMGWVFDGTLWRPTVDFGGGSSGGGGKPGGNTNDTQCNNGAQAFKACANQPVILYVTNSGSDSNSGLTWDTAKLTIYNAICSLPTGNCSTQTAGYGTVYVQGTSAAPTRANPTVGSGIWLMGSGDPNFASPPAGWLKSSNGGLGLSIIGVTNNNNGPNGHIPRADIIAGLSTDNNHPSIWLSSWNTSTLISNLFAFAESSQPGRGVVIGECSDHTRTGTCQSTTITFYNDSFAVAATGTAGPCADIAGTSFWIWFEHSGCNGNAFSATGGRRADNAAAWLLDTSYLITITNSNSAAGGIKVKPGAFGAGLYVKNFTQEGDFSHALPPTVWYTSWGTQVDGVLENVASVDPGAGTDCVVENDGTWGAGGPTVIGGAYSPCIQGQVYLQNVQTFGSGQVLPNPAHNGWVGTINNYLVGETDLARRITGLAPVPYTNLLTTDPSTWTAAAGGGSLAITSVADPFGGTKAGNVVATGVTNLNFRSGFAPFTGAVGDWVVAGVWIKNYSTGGSAILFGPCPTNGGGVFSKSMVNGGYYSTTGAVAEWTFIWAAGKISSVTGANVCFLLNLANGASGQFYGPMQYVLPTATYSDSEVEEFVSTMTSTDSACPVGSICSVNGHPLNVDQEVIRSFEDYFNQGSAPANPASGYCRNYFDTVSGVMKAVNSTGGTCLQTTPIGTYDNFNRASLNTGGPCPSGSCWTTSHGSFAIASNQVQVTTSGTTDSMFFSGIPAASSNQFSQVTVGSGTDLVNNNYGASVLGTVGSGTSANNYSCMEINATIAIQKYVNGAGSNLASGSVTTAVGDILRAESTVVLGTPNVTTINCYQNNVLKLTFADNSSAIISGSPGINSVANNTNVFLDNWSGGPLHPVGQLDLEQDWTQPQHFPAITVGVTTPISGALPLGSIYGVTGNFTTSVATGATPPNCTAGGGTAGTDCLSEGTVTTNTSGTQLLFANAATHELGLLTNGATINPGMLVRAQPSAVNQTAQTAAISTSSLCASAPGACNTAGQYHVSWNIWGSGTACATPGPGGVSFTLSWTDEASVAHAALVLPAFAQTGAASVAVNTTAPTMAFQNSLANESAGGDYTFSSNGSIIQYATSYTACTTGTGAYNLRATITRLQ